MNEIKKYINEFIASDNFCCLGAKAALSQGGIGFGVYDHLTKIDDVVKLHKDMKKFFEFDNEDRRDKKMYQSYIAVFKKDHFDNDEQYHSELWKHLRLLHEIDSNEYSWSDRVERDPNSPNFSYCIGGIPYFVVGMHKNSSRASRSTKYTAIAFNPGQQFENLRVIDKFGTMKKSIRRRDILIQGCINPTLEDYGSGLVAKTYSSYPEGHFGVEFNCDLNNIGEKK